MEHHITRFFNMFKHIPVNKQNRSINSSILRYILNNYNQECCTTIKICSFCGNNIRVLPEKSILVPMKKKNRFLRRLSKNQPDHGTLYQMRSLKKLKKDSEQHLVKYCEICKYRYTKISKIKSEPKVVAQKITPEIKSAKKKKKKDFAGLVTSAVLAVKRNRQNDNNLDNSNTPKKRRLNTSASSNKNSDKLEKNDSIIYVGDNLSPAKKKKTKNPDVINLVTPEKIYSNTENEKFETSDFISLDTPNSVKFEPKIPKKTKKQRKKAKQNSQPNTPVSISKRKAKKLNSLSNLLQDTSKLNKSVSNLKHFVSAIPNN